MSFDGGSLVGYFSRLSSDSQIEDDISSIDDLMLLHDEMFIDISFQILFRRRADVRGLNYYAGRLRQGYSRVSILNQLVRSSEIRPDWSDFPGLANAIDRFRRSRRLLGWRLALFDPELAIVPSRRRARVFQNSVGAQHQVLSQMLRKMEAASVEREKVDGLSELAVIRDTTGARGIHFEQPQPRKIGEVQKADLPDPIKAAVGLLHL